jgi:prepilin-type N-terminal cleavage/methylation domain-containing protein
MNRKSRIQGFTLVELLIVIVLLAALLSIAVPGFVAYTEKARAASCLSNRHNIEQDKRTSYLNNEAQSLVIDNRYKCPSGGVYAWLISDTADPNYPSIGCSLHYGQTPAILTSLGSTFTEITTAMIDLIKKYVQQNGHYPKSSGKSAFTDLGLNPAEWTQPVNGLLYTPAGNQVLIKPATGYTLTIKTTQGTTVTLTPALKWNLIYDVPTKKWYYKQKEDYNVVNISTLQVIKN